DPRGADVGAEAEAQLGLEDEEDGEPHEARPEADRADAGPASGEGGSGLPPGGAAVPQPLPPLLRVRVVEHRRHEAPCLVGSRPRGTIPRGPTAAQGLPGWARCRRGPVSRLY